MSVAPKVALDYLAQAARRVLPLADVDNYNAAIKAIGDVLDAAEAQKAIAADKDAKKAKAS